MSSDGRPNTDLGLGTLFFRHRGGLSSPFYQRNPGQGPRLLEVNWNADRN